MRKKELILIILFYFLVILFIYSNFPKTFFQQDEWAIFGFLIYWAKAGLNWFQRLFVFEQEVHILPFSNLLSYSQFKLFGLNFAPYAFSSILLHSLNSFLVFYLSYLILKKKRLSFVVGLLFAVNSISHQAVTWVATTTGTVNATFFLLLSLIFFFKRNLLLSLLMFLISLGFKESSIFLFAFLPVSWLIFERKITLTKFKKIMIPLLVVSFLYFGLRILLAIHAPPSSNAPETNFQPSAWVYLYRLISLPLKAISQSLIPANFILGLSKILVFVAYPHFAPEGTPDPYLVESVAADIVTYGLTSMILISSWFVFKYFKTLKEDKLLRSLIFSLSFIAFGCLPLILIPGKAGYFSIFEPRHFYILSFGSCLLLGILIFSLSKWLTKKNTKRLMIVFLVPFLLFHSLKIRADINSQVKNSELRKRILTQISSLYPILPEKVIFYTESDKAYYGLPPEETILPFQSGFGQTLLVWYNAHGQNFPSCFFKEKFLYVLLSEDYKFCQGRGFGYFRKFELLTKALKENNLPKESVIAFSYNSTNQSLTDITQKIRKQLK